MGNHYRIMSGNTITAWIIKLPVFVRTYLFLILTTTLLLTFGLLPPYWIFLDWFKIIFRLQVFRLVTNFFFVGSLGFGFLIQLYLLVTYGTELEENERFKTTKADYTIYILQMMVTISGLCYIVGKPAGGESLIMAIIYNWSKYNAGRQINIYGFDADAIY